MSTNLHGQRLPSPSINPINTSLPHTHSYSPITHYSVYEKAINRELSPLSSQNSHHYHDYSLPLHTNSPTLTPNSHSRLQSRPPGPAGLDSSPVISSKAKSLSPRPIETATEKDEEFGEFTLASKRALQSGYCLPQKYDNRTSHATRVVYPDNFAYNMSKSNHQYPESYPHTFQNIPSSPLLDPSNTPFHSSYLQNSNIPTISTKDSSPINNNLAQNQIFLRNLENLTEILTDVNKPASYHPSTKHTEHNYSSIHSYGTQGANQKSQTSYIPSKVTLKIELNNPSQNSFNAINTTKNPPISYEKTTNLAASNTYSLAKRSSLPDRLETAAKDSKMKQGINPSPRKNAAKPIPYLNVQTRQNKTPLKYQASSIHADSKVLSIPASEKPSSYQAILANNQKNSARRSARGTAPITKNAKEMASITTTHSRTSSGYNRNSASSSYAERDNALNYSEMRLGGGYGTKGKAYWQIKAVDTKLEENKKTLLNNLLQNNGGISRDSIQTSPYSGVSTPGGGHDSNYDRVYRSGNSSFTGGNAPPSRQTIYTNVERSSHTTLDDHHSNVSNGGSRLNTKREVSLETKRGLSGKIYIKAGDEPDKEMQFREDYQELERKLNERLQESKARTHVKVKMVGMRNGNEEMSPTRPDPKLFRGRISIKGEGEIKGTSRSFDINSATSIKSATFSNFEGEAGRSLSENRSSSKDILKSLKDFGDNVVQSAKDFIQKVGHQRTRTKCACLYSLQGNEDTCPKAQKWLLSKYRKSELGYLKKTYEKIRDSKDLAPACQKQIALDIRRTHPEIEFFAGSGEGYDWVIWESVY